MEVLSNFGARRADSKVMLIPGQLLLKYGPLLLSDTLCNCTLNPQLPVTISDIYQDAQKCQTQGDEHSFDKTTHAGIMSFLVEVRNDGES